MAKQDLDLILTHAPKVMLCIPVAVASCSRDLRYRWVSQRYADWMGSSPGDIIGRPLAEVIGDAALRSVLPFVEETLHGRTVKFDVQVGLKKLGTRWIEAEYSPTYDATGRPDGWIAAVTDITDRKRAEQQLASHHAALSRLHELSARMTSQDALQTLLDAVVEAAIIVTDAQMGTLRLYDTATDLLRIVAHAGFQRPFLDHFAVVHDAEDICGKALHQRRRIIVEDVRQSPLFVGTPALAVMEEAGALAVQATLLLAHDGSALGVLATHWKQPNRPEASTLQILDLLAREAADLIEHRRREEALEEANRAKDEFLAMLGHELRNPLSPIVTAIEILKTRPNDAKTLEVADRQVQHLVRLVDDLLDVSRITRGKIQIKKHLLRLQDVVSRGVEMAMPLIEQRRHHLDVRLPRTALRVNGDEARLAQVVSNLLTNSAKYTEPGGHLDVEAHLEGNAVVLAVTDTGIGIGADLLPHVFDLFMQQHQSADRSKGGLGIGLTIVRNLVELHGGSVEAASAGEGKGSTFVVRLPLATEEPAALDIKAAAVPSVRAPALRLLVVDDNEDALELLAEVLRGAGHTVWTATDGPKALDALRTFHPDVAVLDIGLPVMDGYELARRIRQELGERAPRLVALTGYGQESDRARAREAGFAYHLTKPVELDCLLAALTVASESGDGQRSAAPYA